MIDFGNKKIKDLYYNGKKIKEAYYGSTKVYSSGYAPQTIIFESSTPGSYQVQLDYTQNYEVILVGGGGGGTHTFFSPYTLKSGGSGALVTGITKINNGIYNIVVGSGGVSNESSASDGTSTSFAEIFANGGKASGGSGGTFTIPTAFSTLQGTNGNSGSTTTTNSNNVLPGGASLYNNYGKGGDSWKTGASSGNDGYIKIVAV